MSKAENAEQMLQPTKTVFLATVREDGLPDARAMTVVKAEGVKTVWMLTGKCADKHRQVSRDAKCMLYATDLEDTENFLELRLWGKMDLLDDAESRSLAWRDDFARYFPGGKDDPNLCVLRFTATSGTLQTFAGKEALTL